MGGTFAPACQLATMAKYYDKCGEIRKKASILGFESSWGRNKVFLSSLFFSPRWKLQPTLPNLPFQAWDRTLIGVLPFQAC